MSQDHKESKVIKETETFRGKWLGMKSVDYTIGSTVHNYEKVFRTTSKEGQIDGVDIIPIVRFKEKKPELMMIVEFRPPVHGFTLEFPTGMTNDEDYEENAKRELLEETGAIVSHFTKIPTPKTYYDPWKSDETSIIFIANIDGDSSESFKEQTLEQNQNIKVVRFQINEDLLTNVANYSKAHKLHVEAKVFSLCLGIWLKTSLQSL